MAGCLDDKTLKQLAKGELSGPLLAAAEAHAESCRRCAKRLARQPAGDDLVAQIRDLEASREEIAPVLSTLPQLAERLTTTLFGP